MSSHARTITVEFTVDYETEGRLADKSLVFYHHDVRFGFGKFGIKSMDIEGVGPAIISHIKADVECSHREDEWAATHPEDAGTL